MGTITAFLNDDRAHVSHIRTTQRRHTECELPISDFWRWTSSYSRPEYNVCEACRLRYLAQLPEGAIQMYDDLDNPTAYRGASPPFPSVDYRRYVLERSIRLAETELAQLDLFGDDEFEVGDVIMFDRTFSQTGKAYTYTALKCENGQWYTSGPRAPGPYAWQQLVRFMITGNTREVWYVSEWTQVV